ncbi:MAG: hypothetical protein II864_07440 [Prevotella sp.]|nr:hypothetical protein [Prevotella sp.]
MDNIQNMNTDGGGSRFDMTYSVAVQAIKEAFSAARQGRSIWSTAKCCRSTMA